MDGIDRSWEKVCFDTILSLFCIYEFVESVSVNIKSMFLASPGKRQTSTKKTLVQARVGAYLLPRTCTTTTLVKDVLGYGFWIFDCAA